MDLRMAGIHGSAYESPQETFRSSALSDELLSQSHAMDPLWSSAELGVGTNPPNAGGVQCERREEKISRMHNGSAVLILLPINCLVRLTADHQARPPLPLHLRMLRREPLQNKDNQGCRPPLDLVPLVLVECHHIVDE